MSVYEKAVFYHFVHALGILLLAAAREIRVDHRERTSPIVVASICGNLSVFWKSLRARDFGRASARRRDTDWRPRLYCRLVGAGL